jgi:hypothetical protein
MLLSDTDQRSQAEIVRAVIDGCLNGDCEGGEENIQLSRDQLPCAFAQLGLPATYEAGAPSSTDALTWANRSFMVICLGSDPSDGHVVLVSGVSQGDEDNPVFVIIDPRRGSSESEECDYESLRIGADFGAGGWEGTVVSL